MSFESVSISTAAIDEAGGRAATLAAPVAPTTPAVVRIGLVGCGGFARFAVRQYRGLPDVSIEAVADIVASTVAGFRATVGAMARRYGAP